MLHPGQLRALVAAAEELGREGRLYDPSDDDVLIYAAELDNAVDVDLAKLTPLERRTIVDAYDRGTGL